MHGDAQLGLEARDAAAIGAAREAVKAVLALPKPERIEALPFADACIPPHWKAAA